MDSCDEIVKSLSALDPKADYHSKVPIFCVFCEFSSDHYIKTMSHICSHLHYKPIKCKHCSQSFSTIHDFVVHGQIHSNKKELDYTYDQRIVLDEWTKRMFRFLVHNKHLKMNPNSCCLVCFKYDDYFNSIQYKTSAFTLEECSIDKVDEFKQAQYVLDPRTLKLQRLQEDQVCLLYHIHYHLQYYPYKCRVKIKNDQNQENCNFNKDGDKKRDCSFRVPFIGKEFYNHLSKEHQINFNFENNNADCYEKTFYIEQLDRLVQNFFKERKDNLKRSFI